MSAPKLTITKAEIIEEVGPVITAKGGQRALVMSRASTLEHGFVFVGPSGKNWVSDFWHQFHVDLREEPYNMETGFGGADYRFATRDPTVLEIAQQWSDAMQVKGIKPPPQQIELDPVRIKLK